MFLVASFGVNISAIVKETNVFGYKEIPVSLSESFLEIGLSSYLNLKV